MNALAWVRQRSLGQVIAGAVVLAALGGVLAWLGTARQVTLVVDGNAKPLFTHAASVGGALRAAGFELDHEDYLQPAAETPLRQVDRIVYRQAALVFLDTPEGSQTLTTAATTPVDILAAAGLFSYPADRLWADGLPVADPTLPLGRVPSRIRLERGHTLTLTLPTQTVVLQSSAATLGEALIEAGYALRQGDALAPQPEALLDTLRSAAYRPARPVQITADGTTLEAMVAGPTVGEALTQAGLALVGLDRAEPAAAEPLPAAGVVRVTRVREQVLLEQVPVPSPIQQEFSADHELDTQTLIDPGAYGMQAKRVRVRYEDGIEVSRTAEGEWLAVEPKPRVVAYGTKIVLKTIDTEYGPLEYYRAVPVYATSYSPCRSGVSNCLYYTSSRKPVERGVIAVRYAWYLALGFGIPVYIPGYGVATVEDIGGGIPGRNWIDLGFSDDEWEQWGSYTTLYFIAPIPPDVPVIFP
jgi:uncharacterized protein YabE (DUF348 family)